MQAVDDSRSFSGWLHLHWILNLPHISSRICSKVILTGDLSASSCYSIGITSVCAHEGQKEVIPKGMGDEYSLRRISYWSDLDRRMFIQRSPEFIFKKNSFHHLESILRTNLALFDTGK